MEPVSLSNSLFLSYPPFSLLSISTPLSPSLPASLSHLLLLLPSVSTLSPSTAPLPLYPRLPLALSTTSPFLSLFFSSSVSRLAKSAWPRWRHRSARLCLCRSVIFLHTCNNSRVWPIGEAIIKARRRFHFQSRQEGAGLRRRLHVLTSVIEVDICIIVISVMMFLIYICSPRR